MDEQKENTTLNKKPWYQSIWFLFLCTCIGVIVFLFQETRPPENFPAKEYLRIEEGMSLKSITLRAEKEHFVKSAALLQTFVLFFATDKAIVAGDYYFETPATVFDVALRIAQTHFGFNSIKVTLPEGTTLKEMAAILDESLPQFSSNEFLSATAGKEGYLFPDTYFFSPKTTTNEVILVLEKTWNEKIKSLEKEFKKTTKSKEEIIIMASLIEKEARNADDDNIIAGILWKRIEIGMPLQVDATFAYTLGKTSAELTKADLKSKNPYNTYVYKGLPPTPIANPGMRALRATLAPEKTPYLFYLHDKNGVAHFAKTFQEHIRNKNLYLR